MNKLESALHYAQLGYSVLPMNGKQPLIKFANTPPLTVEQVKYYWSKYPDANIALRTVDFFVVDVDTKQAHGKDGMKSIKDLSKGVILPTRTQRTASGGFQMFYKKPNQHMKQIIGLLPGVDIKAHPNNYVLVPPSTTEKGTYQWFNADAPIKEPSATLLKMIANYQAPINKHHPLNNPKNDWSKHHTGKRWTGIVLDNLVKGAPEGQRNDYMTRLCGQMIYAGADDNTIWLLLQYTNSFNSPPLENKELEKILSSIIREEIGKS